MKFLSDIRVLLLGIWLGAACFFIAVAQSAFAVLPQREMAGLVVNRTLAILNYSGIGVAAILVIMSLIGSSRVNRFWLWTERVLLVCMVAACAIAQVVIGFWLSSTRAQMPTPIDDVPMDDPLRIQFNVLHQYSEWLLMGAMLAALLTFFIITNRRFDKGNETKPDIYDFSKEFKV
jgi:MFS family permease